MRTAAGQAVSLARRAVNCTLSAADLVAFDAAACSNRASWLQPRRGTSAAAGAAVRGTRAVSRPRPELFTQQQYLSTTPVVYEKAEPVRDQATASGPAAEQQQREQNCWQCGVHLSTSDRFFCPECQSVQPAGAEAQYFDIFGMKHPTFDIDPSELEQRYKSLQRRLHPDKYATASSLEQEFAAQQATAVNQAYDVLKKPLRRAHHILSQRGFGACEGMTITDPELLMSVMEAREEVESTPAGDTAALSALLERNRGLEAQCVQELAEAFRADDLPRAAELTTQLRYICRIQEAIIEKM